MTSRACYVHAISFLTPLSTLTNQQYAHQGCRTAQVVLGRGTGEDTIWSDGSENAVTFLPTRLFFISQQTRLNVTLPRKDLQNQQQLGRSDPSTNLDISSSRASE